MNELIEEISEEIDEVRSILSLITRIEIEIDKDVEKASISTIKKIENIQRKLEVLNASI